MITLNDCGSIRTLIQAKLSSRQAEANSPHILTLVFTDLALEA